MGGQGGENLQGLTAAHRVWTFRIVGGSPFQMQLPNHQPLDHQGRLTVWKLVGSQSLADAARDILTGIGATVDVFAESETPEQTDERIATMAGVDPFPTGE